MNTERETTVPTPPKLYGWAVEYGDGLSSLFVDRARAEKAAVDLHGVIVDLYDLRSEMQCESCKRYLSARLRQF